MAYGYDGICSQRVTAVFDGERKVLCWGDEITEEEIAPFVEHPDYADVRIELIQDRKAESIAHPRYEGEC